MVYLYAEYSTLSHLGRIHTSNEETPATAGGGVFGVDILSEESQR